MSNDLFNLFMQLDDAPAKREEYIRLPFGYPGSKAKSLDYILPHLPYRNTYVEPFGGSGAVLMARKPSNLDVYNDRFGGIVALYRCLKDKEKYKQLMDWLETTIHAREEFIWCAETWENHEDDVERAARWFYSLRTSFGQMGRNFGRETKGKATGVRLRHSLKDFEPLHQRLHNVLIENLDWKHCFTDFDSPDTVFYCDPPYFKTDQSMYKHTFSEQDHINLCDRIFETRGFVALSGYANPIYDQPRYKWTKRLEWDIRNVIKPMAHSETNYKDGKDTVRPDATEVLWIKE